MSDTFQACASIHRDLNRLKGIERCGGRDSFFGQLEIFEWLCEEEHRLLNEQWRKWGRYGNICSPEAVSKALVRLRDEAEFTLEETLRLIRWLQGQGEAYSNPDQLVGAVIMRHETARNYNTTISDIDARLAAMSVPEE